jgi:hypothetical protein
MKYSFKNQWVVGLLGAALHFFRPVFLEGSLIFSSLWTVKKRVSEGKFSGQKRFFRKFRGSASGC